jgi:hypothetical protein
VSKYPADFEPLRLLPLVYADKKKPVVMKLEENFLEMVTFVPFLELCIPLPYFLSHIYN